MKNNTARQSVNAFFYASRQKGSQYLVIAWLFARHPCVICRVNIVLMLCFLTQRVGLLGRCGGL